MSYHTTALLFVRRRLLLMCLFCYQVLCLFHRSLYRAVCLLLPLCLSGVRHDARYIADGSLRRSAGILPAESGLDRHQGPGGQVRVLREARPVHSTSVAGQSVTHAVCDAVSDARVKHNPLTNKVRHSVHPEVTTNNSVL